MKAILNYLLILAGIICFGSSAFAQTSRLVNYQGKLLTNDGTPFTGTTDIQFSIYKTPMSDKPVWGETHENVEVTDGNYDVLLGSANPLKLSFYKYYLEARAEDLDITTPRKEITGFGYNWRLWFLFSAYTIVWVALFAYMFSISRRQKKITADLNKLAQLSAKERVQS